MCEGNWCSAGDNAAINEKVVALDCEMVGIAGPNYEPSDPANTASSALCRVSLVQGSGKKNGDAEVLLDVWVSVEEEVVDFRTAVTGVDKASYAQKPLVSRQEACSRVARYIHGRILVGHALWNDLEVLQITHPPELIRDTALHKGLRPPWRRMLLPSLSLLVSYWLNENMHDGVHDSIQDARAALRLYYLVQDGLPDQAPQVYRHSSARQHTFADHLPVMCRTSYVNSEAGCGTWPPTDSTEVTDGAASLEALLSPRTVSEDTGSSSSTDRVSSNPVADVDDRDTEDSKALFGLHDYPFHAQPAQVAKASRNPGEQALSAGVRNDDDILATPWATRDCLHSSPPDPPPPHPGPGASVVQLSADTDAQWLSAETEDQWPCRACSFMNSNLLTYCEICETPRADAKDQTVPRRGLLEEPELPPPPPPGGPSRSSTGAPRLVPGSPVSACFYGEWHPAHVRRVREDGRIEVLWDSEWSVSTLDAADVLPLPRSSPEALRRGVGASANEAKPPPPPPPPPPAVPLRRPGAPLRSWASVVAGSGDSYLR